MGKSCQGSWGRGEPLRSPAALGGGAASGALSRVSGWPLLGLLWGRVCGQGPTSSAGLLLSALPSLCPRRVPSGAAPHPGYPEAAGTLFSKRNGSWGGGPEV